MSSEPNALESLSLSVRPSNRSHVQEEPERNGGDLCPLGEEEEAQDTAMQTSEQAKPKVLRLPEEPTRKEREEHALTHVPYRSWCAHCVRGRGIESPHPRCEGRPEDAVPLIAGDYGFPGGKKERRGPENDTDRLNHHVGPR